MDLLLCQERVSDLLEAVYGAEERYRRSSEDDEPEVARGGLAFRSYRDMSVPARILRLERNAYRSAHFPVLHQARGSGAGRNPSARQSLWQSQRNMKIGQEEELLTFASAGEFDANALVHVLCEVKDGLAFGLVHGWL